MKFCSSGNFYGVCRYAQFMATWHNTAVTLVTVLCPVTLMAVLYTIVIVLYKRQVRERTRICQYIPTTPQLAFTVVFCEKIIIAATAVATATFKITKGCQYGSIFRNMQVLTNHPSRDYKLVVSL